MALWIIVGVMTFGACCWAIIRMIQARHENPADNRVVHFDQLEGLSNLSEPGPWVIHFYRQSGNPHQDGRIFTHASDAIAAGITVMRRSQIPYVAIRRNAADHLDFGRPFHDHRGRAEGKKLGWVEISRHR